MSTELIISPASGDLPAQLYAPTPKAAKRVLEFFTAQINNDHTRRASPASHLAIVAVEWSGSASPTNVFLRREPPA